MQRQEVWVQLLVASAVFVAAACGGTGQARLDEHLTRARQFEDSGRAREALIEYRNAAQLDARSAEAQKGLARTYRRVGDTEAALRHAVRAADLLPKDGQAQRYASELLLTVGQFEDGRTRAEAALAINPRDVDALILRANAVAGLRQVDQAAKDLAQAIEIDPQRWALESNLGLYKLLQGNRDEAEQAFKRAIDLAPDSADAQVALANFYRATGRPNEAAASYEAAVGKQPDSLEALRAAAIFYLSTRQTLKAEPHLVRLAGAVQDPAVRLVLSDLYARSGRWKEATDVLGPLVQRNGVEREVAQARLAAIQYAQGERQAAHAALDAALAQRPGSPDLLVQKATMLVAERREGEAEPLLRSVLLANASSASGHYLLGVVHLRRGDLEEARKESADALRLEPLFADAKHQLARIDLAMGNPAAALQNLLDAIRLDPDALRYRVTYGEALLANKEPARAAEEFRALVKAAPRSSLLHARLGQALWEAGDRARAQGEFDAALALNPKSFDAISGLVRLDMEIGQRERARRRLQAALAASAEDARLHKLAARTAVALGDPRGAETALLRAIELQPADLDAFNLLVNLYYEQKDWAAARRQLEALLSKRPNVVGALTMMGIVLEAQGDQQGAVRYYEKAVELDPRAGVAANNLAWVTARSGGNLDVALRLAQSAKAAMPDRPEVDDTLAFVYLKKGLGSLAIPAARESLARDPRNPIYHFRLGMAYAQTGDDAKARASLEEALKLKPDFQGADEARKALAELGKS